MPHRLAVILPAAGRSTRFGRPKLLEDLNGLAVIRRSVDAFLSRDDVCCLIIATDARKLIAPLLENDDRVRFTEGGPSRAHSVQQALQIVPDDVKFVAIHDAARPLISPALIDRVFAAAIESRAAGPALPVQLHVRRGGPTLPTQSSGTVPRRGLYAMQTPQIVDADLLRQAFAAAEDLSSVTDDLQLVEAIGVLPTLLIGDERNLKITTPTDLHLASFLLNSPAGISQA